MKLVEKFEKIAAAGICALVLFSACLLAVCENLTYKELSDAPDARSGNDGNGNNDDDDYIPVESVSLPKTLVLTVGDEDDLTATITPAEASNTNIVWWMSSDPRVVSVEDGHLVTSRWGKATIRVKTEDGGRTADCLVTVEPGPGLYVGNNAEPVEDDSFNDGEVVNGDFSADKALTYLKTGGHAVAGTTYTIVIDKDEELAAAQSLNHGGTSLKFQGVTIVLKGYRNEKKVTYTGTASSSMFTLGYTGAAAAPTTLVLDRNIRLVGGENATVPVISLTANGYAALVVNEGAVIQAKGSLTNYNTGSAVTIGTATSLTMTGGLITGTDSFENVCGGIYVNGGAFEMSGGVIENFVMESPNAYVRGAVFITNAAGKFIMSGGTIRNNKVTSEVNNATYYGAGGGVYMTNGTFTMSGTAVIENNEANTVGAGVCAETSATFNMEGGEIRGNRVTGTHTVVSAQTARYFRHACGVAIVGSSAKFYKTGGVIYGVNEGENSNCYEAGPGKSITFNSTEFPPLAVSYSNIAMTTNNDTNKPSKWRTETADESVDLDYSIDANWTKLQ
ncbi:MAG: Ig-like domain-containing protein [Spirochaetaceae bacterium]|nr:Ig-like domain-containing protein [Spirochaetaceae bacterium]